MGDHRSSIKIEMEFHGVKDKCDMWINYIPTDCCSMDERVIKFFRGVYEDGMAKFNEEMAAHEFKRTKGERERAERAEYERLKKKFDPGAEGEGCVPGTLENK